MSAGRRGDGGAKAPRRSRHGYHALRARVAVRGLAALDARTAGARALLEWRESLFDALGGRDVVSPQEAALLEGVTREQLYLDHIDAHLLGLKGGIAGKHRKAALPLLKARQSLQDSIARLLGMLGLKRRPRPAKSLNEVVAEVMAEKAEASQVTQEPAGAERAETGHGCEAEPANSAPGSSEPRQAGRNEPVHGPMTDVVAAEPVVVQPRSLAPALDWATDPAWDSPKAAPVPEAEIAF